MKNGVLYYCPVMGKKVVVKAEVDEKNVKHFSNDRHKGICQVNGGICSGRCMG